MPPRVLLGDEAVALAALHAGITAAYAYPGTPSTEILEYILRQTNNEPGQPRAAWCANEKTAYEQALGVSLAGRRSLVAMKHVGLNVAADPFVNSALVAINGGLVAAVADDPGMHSSQNEQDSRVLADFARIICLEPRNQQEAYDMTREAFELSERFDIPVMLRLVTRLAHSRAVVNVGEAIAQRPLSKAEHQADWILLPSNARRRWRNLLGRQAAFLEYTETSPHNRLSLASQDMGVITAGIGGNYYAENAPEMADTPSHLHIGAYPIPVALVRRLAEHVKRVVVLEDGYPYVERSLKGLLPSALLVHGRQSGHLPPDGELTPDTVRTALGIAPHQATISAGYQVPERPPQLCAGCPHLDSFHALQQALGGRAQSFVASDIGCYTLAALPPLAAIESCVCMGASVGMAKGASDAGLRPAVAVIGDSTFLHSGVTPLMDAVAANTDMTLIIVDNGVVGMTGAQPTLLNSSRLEPLILGLGVDPAHCHVLDAHPRHTTANAAVIRRELDHPGLSVIVAVRVCVEAARARKSAARAAEGVPRMKFDIILAGVGGQGVLSLSSIIASAALDEGLFVKQSEVHGMAQRGGAVTAHLRLSDRPIESDLVPLGTASLVLSLEPLESLRYLDWLAPNGAVVTATQPVANIDHYPALDDLTAVIRRLPHAVLVDAAGIAKRAGLAQATNMVMAGAAAPLLPIRAETIERAVHTRFARKGATVIDQNLAAFRAGQEVGACTGQAVNTATRLVDQARARGDATLLESAGFEILEAAGIRCPRRIPVENAAAAERIKLESLPGEKVVVKVVAGHIAHKSDVGGVVIVANAHDEVVAAIRTMERTFAGQKIAGYSISEFIPYDPSPGGEWLLGLRWTDEFGPVVTLGPGGVATEFLAAALRPGRDVAIFAPRRSSREEIEAGVLRLALTPLATGGVRRQPARTSVAKLCDAIEKFGYLSAICRPDCITDLEINPLVPCGGELVALDVLATVGNGHMPDVTPRPVRKLKSLLSPKSIAILGVSSKMNAGHAILNNVLRDGFDRGSIFVIKPGIAQMEGCQAVPTIRSLPAPVDLLILSVSAAQIPDALIDVVEHRKAESVIVIPGGLEEKAGTTGLVEQMHQTLRAARATDWKGPVVNGGNCLGVRSVPGHYDTMFIPGHKLGATPGPPSPVALISQSGAFAVSRTTRLKGIRPRYSITVGNQMDLTVGDYLRYLEADTDVKVFALYVEGFKPLDGRATFDVISRITASGRTVVLYRGGRTSEGAKATASHTASVAGDYVVTRELARAAGAIVADSLEDFTDLVSMFTLLQSKGVYGRRVGALSNAGYECVVIADNLGDLTLPAFTCCTEAALTATFEQAHISALVDVHNPLDVTPMLDDAGYETVVRRMLEDDNVDVGVVGCVPATAALNTLAASPCHGEDFLREGSIAQRLVEVKDEMHKPWIAIIDAGAIYDPLAEYLQEGGIPTFRTADRALRLLNVFVAERFKHTVRAQMERWVDEFSQPEALSE